MQLFQQYEEDLKELLTAIESKIHGIPNFEHAEKVDQVRSIESEIQDAEQTLRQMSLSAKQVPNNAALLKRAKDYENEISKYKVNLRKAEMQINQKSQRAELFSGLKEDMMASSMDQRARLLETTDTLDRGTTTLKGSVTTALETIVIAEGTMQTMNEQTSQMKGIRDRIDGINNKIGKAGKVLSNMGRRAITNKLIMALIILVLLGALALIIWLKWFYKTGSTSDSSSNQASSTPS